ncbi:MAG: GNAT family N-acetyltransferase [Flavisolibacter sp.]
MIFREATVADIQQIQVVRNSVKENMLSDPNLVTDEECKEFITVRGKGWVCEADNMIVGFSIADLRENNIWALFVRPEYEGKGIGKILHKLMLDWYFSQSKESVWLGTDPDSRAALFYRKAGWKETGMHGKKEIRFEMNKSDWCSHFAS